MTPCTFGGDLDPRRMNWSESFAQMGRLLSPGIVLFRIDLQVRYTFPCIAISWLLARFPKMVIPHIISTPW